MRLELPAKRRTFISLTPLIDVVFLLLIFFMLVSTFLKFSALPITGQAGASGAATLQEMALIDVGADGALRVNGAPVGSDGLRAHLDELIGRGIKRAVVRAGRNAKVQDVVNVLEVTRATALDDVVVAK